MTAALPRRARGLAVAVLLVVTSAAPVAEAVWGRFPLRAPPPRPPDQSWLVDPPEKPSRGKVAVFVFRGDDVYQPVRAAVVRVLRRRGLNVTVTLKPADSAVEYREMSTALSLAVYVEGEMKGEGARQSAVVRLVSGLSGRRISSMRFSGPTPEIVDAIGRTFWTRMGPTVQRACTSVSRPRRQEREPLHIEAGSPEDT